jgi:hypothetical protein
MSADLLSGGPHRFEAYGLTFSSEIRFAHVADSSFTGEADVRIQLGEVFGPAYTPPPTIVVESLPERLLIRGARSATIRVSGGNCITVESLPGGDPEVIRQLLLGWALGGIFHQRGMLPLHASALSDGRDCTVFCAGSGIGKSTLAAAFLNRGFTYLDDNVALVNLRLDGCFVAPGAPELRLWDDSLSALAFEHRVAGPLRPGAGKWSVSAKERFHPWEAPIRKIFILRRTADPGLSFADLAGAAKFRSLMGHVFGLRLVNDPPSRGRLFQLARELAARVAVTEIRLPAKMPSPAALCESILTHETSRDEEFRAGRFGTEGG